MTHKFFPF